MTATSDKGDRRRPLLGAEPWHLAKMLYDRLHGHFSAGLPLVDQCARLTIRNKEGQLVKFMWNSAQRAYWERRPKSGKVLLLKYRQGGFTTLEMADSYIRFKSKSNSQQHFLADEKTKAQMIFNILRRYYEHDQNPPALTAPLSRSLIQGINGSWVLVGTAGARAGGRGFTFDKVHGSEVSRWPGDRESIDDLVTGLCEAARSGLVVLETTANGIDPWFYETWHNPRDWTRVFIAWFLDPAHQIVNMRQEHIDQVLETLDEEEKALVAAYGLTVQQLAWRRQTKFALGPTFYQEFPEDATTAFLISGQCLFDPYKLTVAATRAVRPIRQERRENYLLEVYQEPQPGLAYFIAGDVAEGHVDGDACALSVRDQHGALCVLARFPQEPAEFAYTLADWGYRYNTAMLTPEANGVGRSTLDMLVNVIQYPRIYYERVWNGHGFVRSGRRGWLTTTSSKPRILASYREDFENGTWDVPSIELINDMRRVTRDGRVYETGGRDLFMADAICKELVRQEIIEDRTRRPAAPLFNVPGRG